MKKTITLLAFAFYLHLNAQMITTVAGIGAGGYTGDGGQAISEALNGPNGIAFDAAGNMYISDYDNCRIRKVSTAGIITTVAGTGSCGFSGDSGSATAAKIKLPNGVAFDGAGNMYIADLGNARIRKVNTSGIITTVAGNGTFGGSGDGGPATAAALAQPQGITLDAVGNLYIADYASNVVRKVNSSGIISTVAGNGNRGYSGDGGPATAAQLDAPTGVACDALGNLYISDFSRGGSVRKVNPSGIITTIAGTGSCGSLSCGDGGPAIAAEMYNPYGLTVDASGNVYITDTDNHKVRIVKTSGIIYTIAGNGIGYYSGDGGLAIAAELKYPGGAALDAGGNLFICDQGNNVIRKVTNAAATAGIDEFVNNNEINVYPNPCHGNFVVESYKQTKQTLSLYDVDGRLLLSQPIAGKTSIDASQLPPGVYTIRMTSDARAANKKLVIIR